MDSISSYFIGLTLVTVCINGGAYIVFIVLLLINIVLISILDTKKYNLDYRKEEKILKQNA